MAHTSPFESNGVHFAAIAGSILPAYSADVQDHEGGVVNLDSATSVVLRIQHGATGEVVDFPLTVDTPSQGSVSRAWVSGDLDIRPGTWWGQWRVADPSGLQIWPDPGHCVRHPFGWNGLRIEIWPAIPAPT